MSDKGLFGTSGIRGSETDLFTNQFCFDIGRTFAQFLNKYREFGSAAVGLDPRGSSPRIKDALISGISYENKDVYDQGATPVPSMCYLLQINQDHTGSVMITGSHIKSDLNGIKFFLLGEEILKKHEKEIEEIYYSLKDKENYRDLTEGSNIIHEDRAKAEYFELLLNLSSKDYPKWKVVVDCGNGAQSDVMPQVLSELGVKVVEQNCSIQGEFYARDTEHLPDMMNLIERVKDEKADFGVAFDADGDRVVFVDENGNFVPGDYSASIIGRELNTDSVVTTIAASQVIDSIGKKVLRTKVGAPYVIEEMKSKNIKFGFEPNGGCFFGKIMLTRDGGSTAIHFLNILKESNKSLGGLISELPKFYLAKDKVDYSWDLREQIENAAIDKYKQHKVETLDGVKIWLDDNSWLLFRSSLNAPEFRIFAESPKEDVANRLLEEGKELVNKFV